jgi:bifunctional non-homologous end joining protein LigD
MSLVKYKTRRDFQKTPEPEGEIVQDSHIFVVQKHFARRLHYDFRLAHEGVLKSWAVPKGPSLEPKDKRLAIRTEDHPLDYATFSGTIPEGCYGAGKVEIWDFGTWEPISLAKDKWHFKLHGKQLQGEWVLLKLKNSEDDWILMKLHDVRYSNH